MLSMYTSVSRIPVPSSTNISSSVTCTPKCVYNCAAVSLVSVIRCNRHVVEVYELGNAILRAYTCEQYNDVVLES